MENSRSFEVGKTRAGRIAKFEVFRIPKHDRRNPESKGLMERGAIVRDDVDAALGDQVVNRLVARIKFYFWPAALPSLRLVPAIVVGGEAYEERRLDVFR